MKTPFITVLACAAGWCVAFFTAPVVVTQSAPVRVPLSAPPVASVKVDAVPAAKAAQSVIERFADATGRSDAFTSAVKMLAVVDGMTAEDFAHLRDTPGRTPSANSYGLDQKTGEAFMDALVARWLEVNPAGAMEQIKDLEKRLIIDKGSVWTGSRDFIKALARVNPRMILDDTNSLNDPKAEFNATALAFHTLAKQNLAAAKKYLEQITSPVLKKQAVTAIGTGLAESDPAAAAAMARAENDAGIFNAALSAASRRGAAEIRSVLQLNDRKFEIGYQLAELVVRFPDEDWQQFTRDLGDERDTYGMSDRMARVRARIPPEERQAILANLERVPKAARNDIIGTFFMSWTEENPRAALDWAVKQQGLWKPEDFPPGYALGRWAETDRKAAADWLAAQPASPFRDDLSNSLASVLAYDGKLDEASALFKAAGQSKEVLSQFADALARHNTARAADWLTQLPTGLDTTKAAQSVADQWAEKEPKKAAQWVESLPEGPQRDAAIAGFTGAILKKDASVAAEWVATIADRAVREKAAGLVYGEWLWRDPLAARQWLRELPGIDETFRARVLKRGWR